MIDFVSMNVHIFRNHKDGKVAVVDKLAKPTVEEVVQAKIEVAKMLHKNVKGNY